MAQYLQTGLPRLQSHLEWRFSTSILADVFDPMATWPNPAGVINSSTNPLDRHTGMKQETTEGHNGLMSPALANGENRAGNEASDQSRRRFLGLNLLGLVLAPTASLFVSENAWAARSGRTSDDQPILDPKDPQAHALSYARESHKDHQSCSNCQLYSGIPGEETGPCAIFSYRVAPSGKPLVVDASGWCRAWAPRAER
jgi:hypothetical protein